MTNFWVLTSFFKGCYRIKMSFSYEYLQDNLAKNKAYGHKLRSQDQFLYQRQRDQQ